MMMFPLMTAAILNSTAQINALSQAEFADCQTFALTGTVSSVLYDRHFIIGDDSGRTHIRNYSDKDPARGQRVAVFGKTCVDAYRQKQAQAETIEILGDGPLRLPTPETVIRIAAGCCDFANVTAEGFITDLIRDDIDANWHYLVLEADRAVVYVTIPDLRNTDGASDRLLRRRVRVTGTVIPNHCGARRLIGPHIQVSDATALELLPDTSDPLTEKTGLSELQPFDIVHKNTSTLSGTVSGTWGGRSALIRSDNDEIHRIDLRDGIKPPPVGAYIRASGLPETDLYRLNLSHADYTLPPDAQTVSLTAPTNYPPDLKDNAPDIQWIFHGRSVCLTGRILADPTPASGYRAILRHGSKRISVDVSTLPDPLDRLPIGAEVRVKGCGLIDIDNWRPGAAPPAIKDFVVIVNRPDDIHIISRPSWWTPARLTIVILTLLVILVAVAIWNRVLNRLVERRSRQLHHETIGHAAAELKFQERTRLAVELHDSLSQTLTGIASHIETACRARQKAPELVDRHLAFASQALESCRDDLRDCLWDLRSRTLEETDATTAIRRTMLPHADDCELTIDFTTPRRKLTDNSFHEILCILRELVANAVRHGKAKHIRIAGHTQDGFLHLSVSDDGCGFDPEHHPGTSEGHFGLQGILERLERLDSNLMLDSAPGRGTTASFSIRIQE